MRRGSNSGIGEVIRANNPNNPYTNVADTSYWDSLFEGTDYWDLYQSIINQYSEPVPNTLWGSLTGTDSMNEYDRKQAMFMALTSLASQMRTDKYNSPANQVQLEKAAGLNPDITGLSGTGLTDNPQFDPMAPRGPQASVDAQSGLSIFTSVLSSALGMYKQIKEIQNLSLTNTGLDLGNASSILSVGDKIEPSIKSFITTNMAKGFLGQQNMSMQDLKDMFAEQFAGNPTLSRIARRRWDSVERSSDFETSRNAYNSIMADQKAMKDFEGSMVEYAYLAQRNAYKFQIAKDKYNTEYYNSLDPTSSAQAVNRENANKGWLDKWRNDFYRKMYEDFKYRGSDLAGLILISSGNPHWSGVFGVGGINSQKNSIYNSGINWNDSVIGGLGKYLGMW